MMRVIFDVVAVEAFGKHCGNPGNFKAALLAMLTSSSFTEAVRKNIRAGGCNCSRANLLGACLGAANGIGGDRGVPLAWLEKTHMGEEIFALALERVACQCD